MRGGGGAGSPGQRLKVPFTPIWSHPWKARFAEGMYVASTGWPSLRCTHTGEYLGVPATGNKTGMSKRSKKLNRKDINVFSE